MLTMIKLLVNGVRRFATLLLTAVVFHVVTVLLTAMVFQLVMAVVDGRGAVEDDSVADGANTTAELLPSPQASVG